MNQKHNPPRSGASEIASVMGRILQNPGSTPTSKYFAASYLGKIKPK